MFALPQADIVLEIPVVTLKPTTEEIQGAINKGTQIILSMSKDIPQWEHQHLHHRLQHKVGLLATAVSPTKVMGRQLPTGVLDTFLMKASAAIKLQWNVTEIY